MAAASGCSLARSSARGKAQQLAPRRSRRRRRSPSTFGLPSVRVPVLSTTSVSIFSKRSSASAFLISTPACAPRPTPTMIDIGVARPSAQGQAMISTATAATRPIGEARLGAPDRPGGEGDDGDQRSPPGRTSPTTSSARRWIGARLRCASATMLRRCCASMVSRPTLSARMTKRAGLVERAADQLGASLLRRPASTRR